MSIKTILTLANGSEDGDQILTAAVAVARRFGAHLDVLHVRPDPAGFIPLVGDGMSAAMVGQIMARVTEETTQRRDAARGTFDRVCGTSGLSVAWQETVGREPEIMSQGGRFADLLIMAKRDGELTETLEADLFDSGRPILILPRKPMPPIIDRVVIAWNDSAEAARAVAASMPFLRLASRVDAVIIADVSHQATTNALVLYLGRHGVKVTVHILQAGSRRIGDALLESALRFEADLLVMGAYGHSRFREWVLGGATEEILASGALPVLMMH